MEVIIIIIIIIIIIQMAKQKPQPLIKSKIVYEYIFQFCVIYSYDQIKREDSELIDTVYISFTHCHRHSHLQHCNYHVTVKPTASEAGNKLSITMHWSLGKYRQFEVKNS